MFLAMIEAFVLDKVTKELSSAPLNPAVLTRSLHLKLADPKFHQRGSIDILIPNDVYVGLVMTRKIGD